MRPEKRPPAHGCAILRYCCMTDVVQPILYPTTRPHSVSASTSWTAFKILREMGYGVPDIERAILSARNDVTLIAEAEIQPFAPAWKGFGGYRLFSKPHSDSSKLDEAEIA